MNQVADGTHFGNTVTVLSLLAGGGITAFEVVAN